MLDNLELNNDKWKRRIQERTHQTELGNSAFILSYNFQLYTITVVPIDFIEDEIEVIVGDLLVNRSYTATNLKFEPISPSGLGDLPPNAISQLQNFKLCLAKISPPHELSGDSVIQEYEISSGNINYTYAFLNSIDSEAEPTQITFSESFGAFSFLNSKSSQETIIPSGPIINKDGEWIGLTLTGFAHSKLILAYSAKALADLIEDSFNEDDIGISKKMKGTKSRGFDDEDFMKDAIPAMEEEMLEEVDFLNEDFIRYNVLYGTNREMGDHSAEGSVTYTNKRDDELHLGNCTVSIPKNHKMGEVERPGWFRNFFFGESTKKDFTILHNEKMEQDQFLYHLNEKIGASDEGDVILFIHGFNVEYDAAMMNAAQLGYDLNFKGGITAFSWPSLGSVSGYVADTATARASALYLASFIELIGNQAHKMHIIAHSMGNVVLTDALLLLKNENRLPSAQINEVILAAPDLDKEIFVQQIIPKIRDIARFTLYASSKDKALIASRTIRAGYNRLGEGGEYLTIVEGLESIDASAVDTSLLGHGYFSDTLSLIHDIRQVLLGELPHERILTEHFRLIDGEQARYWTFRNS
jgi:esterase/lipase superfamily enzyme